MARLSLTPLLLVSSPLWAAGMEWPPLSGAPAPTLTVRAGGGAAWGLVPEFQAAERDRVVGEGALSWSPDGPVRLDLRGGALSDRYASGRVQSGAGDLRLGVDARLWRFAPGAQLRGGWQVKLPNASDEVGLGTDETDSTLLVAALARLGGVSLGLTGGLAILGNPLQFANQDDVPITWLSAQAPLGPVVLGGRAGGGLRTSRNPARLGGALFVEGRCPWLMGAEAQAGVSPAAPDLGVRAWVGWGWQCPD